ncbi:MAG: protein O-GlcNAcase [Mycobacterium leprae]
MGFSIRGVIEGFYGRPWSWAERERMVDFMGQHGYNLYIYAPKNDPIHRNRWREPYLPEELERFHSLLLRCEANGIEFVYGISPLAYHYNSEEYWAVLWSKLEPLHRIGCRSFSVLLDDMPDKFRYPDDETRFGSIAGAQTWLNNRVAAALAEAGGLKRLVFCPTEYHGEGDSPYLRELGEKLSPVVEVEWTGREVCSPQLTTAEGRKLSSVLKRPVLFWDNYPVNDLDMQMDPHIRPIRGRDADLDTACAGIVVNGALQPEASLIAFHTYAQYMADPKGYKPDMAWQKALLAVTGNAEDAAAVALLGDLSRRSALEKGEHLNNRLLPELTLFWERWGGVPAVAGPDLPDLPESAPKVKPGPGTAADRALALQEIGEEFDYMRRAADRLLTGMANLELQADLRPWATKMHGWALVGEQAVAVLSRALANPHDPGLSMVRRAVLDQILTTRENFHWVNGDLIDQFARRALWAAERLKEEETR